MLRPFNDDVLDSAMFVIAATTIAIFAVDIGWQRVYRRASTGLDFTRDDPSWPRTLVKLAGLLASIAMVGVAYWLIPEYRRRLYGYYHDFLRVVVGPWIVLSIPYFFWVDRKMREPRDGYWQMGRLVMLQWRGIDRRMLWQHVLGWTIKGFFLALMFSYLCNDLRWLLLFDFGALGSFKATYPFIYRFIFFVDVSIATLGYLMCFRPTDTHFRSAEPTLLGWVVTLACYEPFWSAVGGRLLPYDTGYPWDAWLQYHPALYTTWGTVILVLSAIYVWATVSFGARFSNLTHRGIITNGPYRWTKHPAYVAKNLTWWMISVPFMPRGGLSGDPRPLRDALRRQPDLRAAGENRGMAPVARSGVRPVRDVDRAARVLQVRDPAAVPALAGLSAARRAKPLRRSGRATRPPPYSAAASGRRCRDYLVTWICVAALFPDASVAVTLIVWVPEVTLRVFQV